MNITKKYRVASSAMVSKMVGILRFEAFDFIAQNMVNENARESGAYILVEMNIDRFNHKIILTHQRKERGSYTRSLRFCSGRIHKNDMRQMVSVGGSRLHTRSYSEARGCSGLDMAFLSPELILTFLPYRDGHHKYPEHELGNSDKHKSSRDDSAFPGHGVYPVTVFSEISSELFKNRRNPT